MKRSIDDIITDMREQFNSKQDTEDIHLTAESLLTEALMRVCEFSVYKDRAGELIELFYKIKNGIIK